MYPYLNFCHVLRNNLLNISSWFFSVYAHNKGAVILFLILLISDQFLRKNYFNVSLISSLLFVSDISSLFAILGGLGLFYLYKYFRKELSLKQFVTYIAPLFLTLVCFGLFYWINGTTNNVALNQDEFFKQFDTIEEWKRIMNIIGKSVLQSAISLAIFILIVFKSRILRIQFGNFFLLIGFIYFSGLFSWALLNQMQDSVQFYVNAVNFFILISMLIIIYYSISTIKSKKNQLYFLLVIGIFFSYQYYSKYKDNYKNVSFSEFKIDKLGLKNASFAYLKKQEDYASKNVQYEQIYIGQLNSLAYEFDPLKIVCLSIDQIPVESNIDQKYYNTLTFNKYIESKKSSSNIENTFEYYQVGFIKEYSISHLLIFNNRELPTQFDGLFNKSKIGIVDNYAIYERL